MSWSPNDLLIALRADKRADGDGLSFEQCEAVLGVDSERNVGDRGAVYRALDTLRIDGHVVADDHGIYRLVCERAER
jgi:hypothetical protein